MSRHPSQQSFIPIGHISLDSKNPDAAGLGIEVPSDGVYWIKTFFVQHFLQSKGVGRAAMDEVEGMAVSPPLLAKTLMLDTVEKGDQLREDFAKATYNGIPKVPTSLLGLGNGRIAYIFRLQIKIGILDGDTRRLEWCKTITMLEIAMAKGGIQRQSS